MGYRFYNANAVNRYTDDCVVRSISCATGKSWDYVYDYLSDIAQYEGTLFDKKDFVRGYLDRTYQKLDGIYGSVGYISAMFPENTLLIALSNHLVCSINGIVYDTFDCRDREDIEGVWLVK